ncbi:unnamed protein product [Ranitomeya imitator]|uniref:Non-selective voltage-gated ion channel VDAC2 n=1 Tax=Ranitomeya imitator TaxID=111125 RepID=A0ABN9MFZ4_9NEOB|nr:unnamed protein product [Ranitomeya imitator]
MGKKILIVVFPEQPDPFNPNIAQILKFLLKGLELGLSPSTLKVQVSALGSFFHQDLANSKKSGKVKAAYKREYVNLGCDVDFDFAGPAIHGAAVVGYEGWLAGYQMTFDSAKSKLTKNNFAVGYKTGDFQLHTNVNDGSEFAGSIYQKVSDKLETAVNLAWTSGNNSTRFGIAAKYQLDSNASLSAKVNNASLVGVGYTQTLRPGVKLALSALVDGKNINAGGHKLGLGLELEA